ncbi:helix-turn-helix domain-containing protein [Paraburkholderia sp. PGU19]|uniref:helix-turn-helix domain-containing protein n=1 Tax=Paraburkholderia sp. PGU19 TaxID=2735434 RepID=UPI0015DAB018|nr:helix-turn-helix domain-containing protein [Paraburkholderia sp. PGU19]
MATVQNDRLSELSARVSNCLLAMFNPELHPVGSAEIALTQEEIGCLSGITGQKVNRAVRLLQEMGLVSISYRRVEVTNLEGLRRIEDLAS